MHKESSERAATVLRFLPVFFCGGTIYDMRTSYRRYGLVAMHDMFLLMCGAWVVKKKHFCTVVLVVQYIQLMKTKILAAIPKTHLEIPLLTESRHRNSAVQTYFFLAAIYINSPDTKKKTNPTQKRLKEKARKQPQDQRNPNPKRGLHHCTIRLRIKISVFRTKYTPHEST